MIDIQQQIISIIAQAINVDPVTLSATTAAGDIPQWDSMGNIAIISAIEEQLEVEFPLEDLFELNSVEAFANKVIELRNA